MYISKALRRSNVFLIIGVMLLTLGGTLQLGTTTASHSQVSSVPDPQSNDIISGGVSSEADLRDKYVNGDGVYEPSNIQAIFHEAIGVQNSEALTNLQRGTVHRNGNVTVNGEVVATNARSTGRHNLGGSQQFPHTKVWIGPPSARFNQEQLPALVRMVNGQFHYAVLMNCGNPVQADAVTQPPPEEADFNCTDLRADVRGGEAPLEVTFTARAEAENTNITGYEFRFGDGETETVNSSNTEVGTSHTYTEPGNYAADVNVITEDGETGFTDRCAVAITVTEQSQPEQAAFECRDLRIDDRQGEAPFTANFTATADVNNTEITGYEFQFGDGESTTVNTNNTEATVSHTYEEAGDYTARVNVITEDGETGFRSRCQVNVTVEEKEQPQPQPEEEEEQQQQQQQQQNVNVEQNVDVNQQPQPEREVVERERIIVQQPQQQEQQQQQQPQVQQQQQQQPQVERQAQELPNTGVGSLAMSLMGSASLGVGIRGWWRSRRKLLNDLLSR